MNEARQQIFRQSALERLSTPEQLDRMLVMPQTLGWLSLSTMLCGIALFLAWSLVVPVPVTIQAQGILIRPGGVLDVVATSAGLVVDLKVKPGDAIQTGATVAILDQPDLRKELEAAAAERLEAEQRHKLLVAHTEKILAANGELHKARHAALTQTLEYLKEQILWLEKREQQELSLVDKQVIIQQTPIDTRIELNSIRSKRADTQNLLQQGLLEWRSLEIAQQNGIQESEMKLRQLSRREEGLKDRIARSTTLTSPYTGVVVELKVNPGEILHLGQPLLNLIPMASSDASPRTQLLGVIYAPPADGKKVTPGMMARLFPSTVNREEYGFIHGRVLQVATIPATQEGMMRTIKNQQLVTQLSGQGAPFEIIVELATDTSTPTGYRWSSSQGPVGEISTGTLCLAELVVRRIRLASLAIPALERLLPQGPLDEAFGL